MLATSLRAAIVLTIDIMTRDDDRYAQCARKMIGKTMRGDQLLTKYEQDDDVARSIIVMIIAKRFTIQKTIR
jgi:hypothetical protein